MPALPFGGDAIAYQRRVLTKLPKAETVEAIEALLPRNTHSDQKGYSRYAPDIEFYAIDGPADIHDRGVGERPVLE